jgi:recombination protein RecR
MRRFPEAIEQLIEEFSRLPGVGPKTAERYIYALLKLPKRDLEVFGKSLAALQDRIGVCTTCFNFSDSSPCEICRDSGRNAAQICIVAEASDLHALERSGAFTGKYHVLGGLLRPIAGITPEHLTVEALERRIRENGAEELILALDPTMEGEATGQYLVKRLGKRKGLRITRLARGLPMGADIAYADDMTLGSAFEHREALPNAREKE